MVDRKLHLYTIMPLIEAHMDEYCEDIRRQYEQGVASCVLFCMTLVPEGDPPVDKAEILSGIYAKYKEKLDAMGIPSGVLVQASIGHDRVLGKMFPYQQYVGLNHGQARYVVCPYDQGFREYMYRAFRSIALRHPDHIMLDDDFRLIYRNGGGCACPLHMERFHQLSGTELTREQLLATIADGTERGKEYRRLMLQTQEESLVECVKYMRAGIDSVDPTIPTSYCCCSNDVDFAVQIVKTLACPGQPLMVRINNANYTSAGPRNFSRSFFYAGAQIAKLREQVDIILAETDTCPQNRYSTGAMSLHTHFTGSILEGAQGAKHWITRMAAFEPNSGKAYRRILGKYRDFYETLATIVPGIQWLGCRIPVSRVSDPQLGISWGQEQVNAWGLCVLERMGLPMYFSAEDGGVLCLEGEADLRISDAQLLQALKGTVFLSADAAAALIRRGFGKYLGVDVRPWDGIPATGEYDHYTENKIGRQVGLRQIVALDESVEAQSMIYHTIDNLHYTWLFPGVAVYRNSLGGTAVTFCGTPRAQHTLSEAFAFLNESRKKQLIRLLQHAGQLPVYFPGDEEVYLKAGLMEDGRLLCAVFNLGTDPIEALELVTERNPRAIEVLLPDGTSKQVPFRQTGEATILELPCNTLEPVILFISL